MGCGNAVIPYGKNEGIVKSFTSWGLRSNQGCTRRTTVGNPAIEPPPPSGRNPAIEPPPLRLKKIALYLVLNWSNFFSALSAPKKTPKLYIFVFYCVLCVIGPITGLLCTRLSIWTLKCRFLKFGQK